MVNRDPLTLAVLLLFGALMLFTIMTRTPGTAPPEQPDQGITKED